MPQFLILQLKGPMQSWGIHTYEDFRPSNLFPTRSALLGLIGACLGIDRRDRQGMRRLAKSLEFTVKVDRSGIKMTDYHTVIEARRANRKPKEGETVQTWREYLFDASSYIAIGERSGSAAILNEIEKAVQKPIFTPSLGRRCCPLSAPLFVAMQAAETGKAALDLLFCEKGVVYDEKKPSDGAQCLILRDVPLHGIKRQFGTRMVYVHSEKKEGRDVS